MKTEIVLDEILRMLNKYDWADHDVKLKLNEETGDYEFEDKDDSNYGSICYLIALNTMAKFNKLQSSEGITGCQHEMIIDILNTLIDDRLLSPIEDTDDTWGCADSSLPYNIRLNGTKSYQCKRYTSLFKDVLPDGSIHYTDSRRFTFKDSNGACFRCGTLSNIAEEYFGKITMPYLPKKSIVFDTITFDSEGGDPGCCDTICIYDMCGKSIFVDTDGNSLTKEEFLNRYEKYRKICKGTPVELKMEKIKT